MNSDARRRAQTTNALHPVPHSIAGPGNELARFEHAATMLREHRGDGHIAVLGWPATSWTTKGH
ncbi:helix-turn-helix domain-containing protein [Streptomyces sp. NPDC003042]